MDTQVARHAVTSGRVTFEECFTCEHYRELTASLLQQHGDGQMDRFKMQPNWWPCWDGTDTIRSALRDLVTSDYDGESRPKTVLHDHGEHEILVTLTSLCRSLLWSPILLYTPFTLGLRPLESLRESDGDTVTICHFIYNKVVRGSLILARNCTAPHWTGPHQHRTAPSSNAGARTTPQLLYCGTCLPRIAPWRMREPTSHRKLLYGGARLCYELTI